MKNQQQKLNLTTNAPAKAVGEFEFEPIRGQPMLRWNGKRAFTATSYFPAQEKERHGDEVNGWMNRIPESNTLRSYYPDFLAQKKDGSYVIVEVKGENKIDDAVVKAKARSALQLAAANAMTYELIPSMKAAYGLHQPASLMA